MATPLVKNIGQHGPAARLALLLGLLAAGCSAMFPTRIDVPAAGAAPALPGELTMPRGAGPFPAVVLLHGCSGVAPARERLAEQAAWYADRGYAALVLDSLTSRGVPTVCSGGEPTPFTRALDAYRGLAYLASLGTIDPRRVVLQGLSHGGATVLTALDELTVDMARTPLRFIAGVAYYPGCTPSINAEFYAPVLILIGEKDDWTPAAACEQLHARQQAQSPGRVRLTVYPGATHAFDFNVPPRVNQYGKFLTYDPGATLDATRRVDAFLREMVR